MVDGLMLPSEAAEAAAAAAAAAAAGEAVSHRAASQHSDVCGFAFRSAFFQPVLPPTFRDRRTYSNAAAATFDQQPRWSSLLVTDETRPVGIGRIASCERGS